MADPAELIDEVETTFKTWLENPCHATKEDWRTARSALLAALTPTHSAEDAAVPTWQPMSTVPLIEDAPILLLTSYNGVTEARFSPGYWTDHHEGREYSGPGWVCGDDEWQIEIEEISKDPSEWHHGSALGWLPRTALPAAPESPR